MYSRTNELQRGAEGSLTAGRKFALQKDLSITGLYLVAAGHNLTIVSLAALKIKYKRS